MRFLAFYVFLLQEVKTQAQRILLNRQFFLKNLGAFRFLIYAQ